MLCLDKLFFNKKKLTSTLVLLISIKITTNVILLILCCFKVTFQNITIYFVAQKLKKKVLAVLIRRFQCSKLVLLNLFLVAEPFFKFNFSAEPLILILHKILFYST